MNLLLILLFYVITSRHMEGAEFKFWIDRLSDMISEHYEGNERYSDWYWKPSEYYLDDFAKFINDLYVRDQFVKYISPEVLSASFVRANVL